MKRLIVLITFLVSTIAFSQGGPKVDVVKYRGKVTTTFRNTIDVPSGETWLIHNVTTNSFQWANDDDVWKELDTDTDDQTASEVTSSPFGGISSSDVQAALQELDTEKVNIEGTNTVSSNLRIYRNISESGIEIRNDNSLQLDGGNIGDKVSIVIDEGGITTFSYPTSKIDTDTKLTTKKYVDSTITANATDNQTASEVPLTTAVNGETDVQASLEDHETRIDALSAGGADGNDFVDGLSLLGTTLTANVPNQTNPTVDLAPLQDGTGTDDQTIDVFNLNGTDLELSLEGDGEATQTVDLSSFGGGAAQLNDLSDVLITGTPSNNDFLIYSAGNWVNGIFNASGVPFTPNGSIAATDVQAAIQEVRDEASGGSGNVTKVGTPANDQVGVWTGDGTIEGHTGLTYNSSNQELSVGSAIGTPAIVINRTEYIPTDTEPTSSKGNVYFDDSENTLKQYNGSAWEALNDGGTSLGTKVADYAALAAISSPSDGDLARIEEGPKRGVFVYDSALSATDDKGFIISGWVRQTNDNRILAGYFGVDVNSADNSTALQDAIDYAEASPNSSRSVYLPVGNIKYSTSITLDGANLIGDGNYSADYNVSLNRGPTLFYEGTSGNAINITSSSLWKLTNLRVESSDAGVDALISCGDLFNGVSLDRVFLKGGKYNIEITGNTIGLGLLINDSYLTGASVANIYTPEAGVTGSLGIVFENGLVDVAADGFINFAHTSAKIWMENTYFENLSSVDSFIKYTEESSFPSINIKSTDNRFSLASCNNYFRNEYGGGNIAIESVSSNLPGTNLYVSDNYAADNTTMPSFSSLARLSFSPAGIRDVRIAKANGNFYTEITPREATDRVLPSSGGEIMRFNDNVATTVENITGSDYTGETIKVYFNKPNTTIDFSTGNLKGNGGVDWAAPEGAMMTMTNIGTASSNVWVCEIADIALGPVSATEFIGSGASLTGVVKVDSESDEATVNVGFANDYTSLVAMSPAANDLVVSKVLDITAEWNTLNGTITVIGKFVADDTSPDEATWTLNDFDIGEQVEIYTNRTSAPTLAGATYNELTDYSEGFVSGQDQVWTFYGTPLSSTVDYIVTNR